MEKKLIITKKQLFQLKLSWKKVMKNQTTFIERDKKKTNKKDIEMKKYKKKTLNFVS